MENRRKALLAKMKANREEAKARIKATPFVLPDLHGPAGNAFALLGYAEGLLKDAGADDATRSLFHSQATSGDYDQLLGTIEDWFTVVVPVTTYAPLKGSILKQRPLVTDDDEDMEASMLAAKEKYVQYEDSGEPEVLDLRGLTPAETMRKLAEHATKEEGK